MMIVGGISSLAENKELSSFINQAINEILVTTGLQDYIDQYSDIFEKYENISLLFLETINILFDFLMILFNIFFKVSLKQYCRQSTIPNYPFCQISRNNSFVLLKTFSSHCIHIW